MKKNIKIIIFIIIAIIALYLTRTKFEDHSLNKSSEMTKEQAEKYCKKEIYKNLEK
mgnify:CR=1 FL=1